MPNDYILRSDVEKLANKMLIDLSSIDSESLIIELRKNTLIEFIDELSSIQSVDRTDDEIIFDIKRDIYLLQRKYEDFELMKAYDAIADFIPNPPSNEKKINSSKESERLDE